MTDSEQAAPAQQTAPAQRGPELEWIDYAVFGERFFARAVTKERIEAGLAGMAGKGMKIGPFGVGPMGMASVVAEGSVGKPVITRVQPNVAFDLMLPVSLSVVATLAGQQVALEIGIEIDLDLHARAAAPLLIVIDIPRITERDVRLVVRAEAVGAAWDWIIEPIGKVVRREVASRINAMLAERDSMRGRVFDIAARIDGVPDNGPDDLNFEWISYGEFGHRFFERAVTLERIRDGVEGVGGRQIDIGPMKAGPRDMATVTAKGKVGKPEVSNRSGDLIAFDLNIPVTLDLVVAVGSENRYQADIDIPLILTARAADPLLIVIDVPGPRATDIPIELKSLGRRASLLSFIGGVKNQIRDQVAAVVNDEVSDPSGRTVDIGERIDSA